MLDPTFSFVVDNFKCAWIFMVSNLFQFCSVLPSDRLIGHSTFCNASVVCSSSICLKGVQLYWAFQFVLLSPLIALFPIFSQKFRSITCTSRFKDMLWISLHYFSIPACLQDNWTCKPDFWRPRRFIEGGTGASLRYCDSKPGILENFLVVRLLKRKESCNTFMPC